MGIPQKYQATLPKAWLDQFIYTVTIKCNYCSVAFCSMVMTGIFDP
jgi:hypothetical protein